MACLTGFLLRLLHYVRVGGSNVNITVGKRQSTGIQLPYSFIVCDMAASIDTDSDSVIENS